MPAPRLWPGGLGSVTVSSLLCDCGSPERKVLSMQMPERQEGENGEGLARTTVLLRSGERGPGGKCGDGSRTCPVTTLPAAVRPCRPGGWPSIGGSADEK